MQGEIAMKGKLYKNDWYDIDTTIYNRSVHIFRSVKNMLSVNMKLHADSQLEQGDIFLFNHFSRFETFIPQFLIYEQTGAYCCAIASGEFFKEDSLLSKYLQNVGVFPHDHPRLFPILAAQIFRGRKVIIFPEGGMVKDRQVLDNKGEYNIFSRVTGLRRKHHTGAAVLAQGIEAFKTSIRNAYCKKNTELLTSWKDQLNLDNLDQLLTAALKPTLIIPANITFYPIRASENFLQKGIQLLNENLSLRQTEELLVEGNIMFKDTDMDIRMGKPVDPYHVWHWWNRYLLEALSSENLSLDDIFTLHSHPKNFKQRIMGLYFKKNAADTRDQYMKEIYANVTINLSHLASSLIMMCIDQGMFEIEKQHFYTTLYIAVKHLQKIKQVNLHRSLLNPDEYEGLVLGTSERFEHFICVAKTSELIEESENIYHFLPKLLKDHDFDVIRMENLIAVYNNEAKPVKEVTDTLKKALNKYKHITEKELSELFFDDELCALAWEQKIYSDPRYAEINQQETAHASAEPFFLKPETANGMGILLVHGLLARPAELRSYGEFLCKQGYVVIAPRLKGHGTSPYALRDQSWEDWYGSVARCFEVLKHHCRQIVLIGFSSGGALSLKLAAEQHPEIIAVVAVAVPVKFVDKSFMLVPLVHGTNKLVRWVSSLEGVKPFIDNNPEHPNINYRNTPIRSLFELRRLINNLDDILPQVKIPVLIIYADQDPVVSVDSATSLIKKIGSQHKHLKIINASHHGILKDNSGDTWAIIDHFLKQISMHTFEPEGLSSSKNNNLIELQDYQTTQG